MVSTVIETGASTALELSLLEFEEEQECDFLAVCINPATWRATCTMSGCWALVCHEHVRVLYSRQTIAATRRGQRCRGCGKVAANILRFDPLVFPGAEGRLW